MQKRHQKKLIAVKKTNNLNLTTKSKFNHNVNIVKQHKIHSLVENIITVQPRKDQGRQRIIFIIITFISVLILVAAIGGLAYIIPQIKEFNYFNNQFRDAFQSTGKYSNGKYAIPNYNYSNVNKNKNQYDNVMLHVSNMTKNMPRNWLIDSPPSHSRQFDYYYAMMQMEKYAFQLMPSYIKQIQDNKNKLIKHGNKYKNSLPMKLLLHSGTVVKPGDIKKADNEGSDGFFVNEKQTSSNVNDGLSYASKQKPAGFFPDSIRIIKKFQSIFSQNPETIYDANDEKNDLPSPLENFNRYFSSGGKSNYYPNSKLKAGISFLTNQLNTNKEQGIGQIDNAESSTKNLTSDGFILRALLSFSTDYAFTVQNYFLNPLTNQLNGVYKFGVANMIKKHKVSFNNLLWFFYNRIVINLAASLFRQSVFAPLLFVEGRNLSSNLLKTGKQFPIVPEDNSILNGDHNKTVFFEKHTKDFIYKNKNSESISQGRVINSWLFIDGVPKIPIKFRPFLRPFNYLPFFQVLPLFKHAADVVIISEILDSLNYIMFTQTEHILLYGKFKNVSKNWKIITEAEAAFQYYFKTFTNVSENNEKSSTGATGESFNQARGDFYCAADLSNPKYSEIHSGLSNIRKPLAITKYNDPKSHFVYDNYLEYLCKSAPNLLSSNINGDIVWTGKHTKTLYQFLAEQMFEFDHNVSSDVKNFNDSIKMNKEKWTKLNPSDYIGFDYYRQLTEFFSYRQNQKHNIKW